ncbi:MAG: hypothetical protein IH600_18215 [Bacteroidetes bacterium]|nr:hypothetical protein [Bacteroidota bacterium]
MRTILFYLLTLLALLAAKTGAQPVWEYENGPCGGTFLAIIEHQGGLVAAPSYRSFVLFGNAEGTQWRQADLPDPAAQPFSLYSSGTRLFAGGFGRVYRSDDAGATWQVSEIPDLQSAQITRLTGHGDTLYGSAQGMLMRSIDHGVRWSLISLGDVRDVVMADDGYVVVAEAGQVLESTDGGANWFTRTASPPDIQKLYQIGSALYAARKVSPLRPLEPVLFRITDRGAASWEPLAVYEPFITSMTEHTGVLYAGSDTDPGPQLLRSLDGGRQWEAINETRLPFPRPKAVSVLLGVKDGLLAGITHLGIWRLEDNAESWRYVTDGYFPVGVARVGFVGDRIVAYSMKENLVAYHDVRDDPWQLLPYAEESRPGDMRVKDGRVTLGTTYGTRGTTDFGTSWEYGAIGDGSRRVQALGTASGRMIAGAEYGVHAWSDDEGRSWTADTTRGVQTWYTFAEGQAGALYAATTPLGLLSSSDTGRTWTPVIVPSMEGTIFDVVEAGGLLYVASNKGIASCTSDGGSVVSLYPGAAYRLCATPRGLVAATQDDGIILFPAYGAPWGSLNQGLPEAHFATPDVCRIAFAYDNGRLYFGNCGMPGLWSVDVLTAMSARNAAAPGSAGIDAVYPQPLSGRGWISLRVPVGRPFRLGVCDLFGRRMRTLSEGIASQPTLTLPVDAGTLPVGVSFLLLETGERREAFVFCIAR